MDEQIDMMKSETCSFVFNGTKEVSSTADRIPEVSTTSITKKLRLDPEKLLSAYGKYGKYQMRTYILLTLPAFFYSSQMLIMGFITHAPSFQCIIDLPDSSSSSIYQVLDNCHIFELKTQQIIQCSEVPNSTYLYKEEVPFSTVNSEFDLVCNDEYWAEHGSSLFMLGALLIPVFTHLSDLYGRRKLFLFTLWVASITAIACSMAPTIFTFLACRFIIGVATAGTYAIIWIMCCESVAIEFRSLIPVAYTVAWVLGIMLVGVLRIWILNWRWLYFTISIPSILSVFYYWLLPESPYWSISHNKQHAIERYIENACRYNNVNIDVSKCELELQQPDEQHGSRSIMDILRNRVALFHLIVQCYVVSVISSSAAMNISYWGMALLSTTLSEDGYTGYFLSGFIELPGGLLAVVFLLKFGRRSISIWSFFMQSLLYFMAVLFPGIGTVQMVLAVIAKFFNSFVWVAQPLMLAEMSPTTIRNTFYGIVQFFAEIGSIAAPYLPLLIKINPVAPQAAVAVFSFTATLFLLTAPETKDRPMPEDLDQFDPGCFLQMFDYRMQKKRGVLITAKDIEETSSMTQMQPEEEKLGNGN
ncbi:transporter, major facilitator family protein [Onchocerca flexuosa]|uniref:Transporter, major facilitator family protein n=1 Tax=Onchocerca flexuosa TaxID=387005 RepID=A0A238C1Y5_9BILA|nr:transporter, major facilitator family protein [Onchocerca flexuosa]